MAAMLLRLCTILAHRLPFTEGQSYDSRMRRSSVKVWKAGFVFYVWLEICRHNGSSCWIELAVDVPFNQLKCCLPIHSLLSGKLNSTHFRNSLRQVHWAQLCLERQRREFRQGGQELYCHQSLESPSSGTYQPCFASLRLTAQACQRMPSDRRERNDVGLARPPLPQFSNTWQSVIHVGATPSPPTVPCRRAAAAASAAFLNTTQSRSGKCGLVLPRFEHGVGAQHW